jgi:pimeloyl-ACP methyl ester carboxylesterase
VPIGGTTQWVSVRGKDRRSPVMVVIHGGPGTPTLPMAWAFQAPWEDFFTVVHHDQRGVGKNAVNADRNALTPTLTFDRLVADAEEVVVVIQVRHDLHTPYEPARAWVERLQAPHKRLVTLEHSAHVPMLEEPGRFLLALVTEVLPLSMAGDSSPRVSK